MSIASKWFDLVVGIDLHFELVPPSPAPIPFPHPFVGLLFDPLGLIIEEIVASGMALLGFPPEPGPVLVGGLPAIATGDDASMPFGHILLPPGVSWAPIPKVPIPGLGTRKPSMPDLPLPPSGDAMMWFGSLTVEWRGGRAVRMGDPAFSCSDPVRLPTSFVVSTIPTTVIVGGPPALDWSSLLDAVKSAVGNKWLSKVLHAGVEKFVPKRLTRARDFLHDTVCFFTGHPVNVVNGSLVTTWTDFELPGTIPISMSRRYRSSFCDRDSVLGHGWSHSLDQQVWLEDGRVVVLTEDGRELEFDTWDLHERAMRQGDEIYDPVNRLTLRSLGQFRWELEGTDGLIREFSPIPGESQQNLDRGLSRLVAIRNRAGDHVQLQYDKGRLQSLRDSGGRPVAFEYDHQGRLKTLWLPAPSGEGMRQHAAYRYSPQGDLVECYDALGKVVRFEYDRHCLVKETDRNGLRFYFEYDGWGPFARCTRTWGDGGILDHVITYDVKGRRTVVEDSLGHAKVFEYGPYGLVTSITDARGGVTKYEYDDRLQRCAVIEPDGSETRTKHDARSNPVEIVEPGGAVTKIEYDAGDRPVLLTTPKGAQWRWSYDRAGRRLTETDPLGVTTRYHYDKGRLVAIDEAGSARTMLKHDSAGNLVELVNPDGTAHRFAYDALGRVATSTDAKGAVRRWIRDALGRSIRIDEPDGNVRELQYDGEGYVVRARDRLREIEFTYQGLGKPTSRTIAGTTVRFEYDTEERLTAFINEKGLAYRFERDPVGDLLAEMCFDETRKVYQRDKAGRVTEVLRPGVRKSTKYAYDAAGRLAEVAHSDGLTETFAYDEDGLLVEASNPSVTVKLERDLLGRVVKETQGEYEVASQYDHRSLRIGMESSLGARQQVSRNAMGDVVGLIATQGERRWEAAITRDVMGLEVDRQLPGGARSYWWRDTLGRPTQHWVGKEQATARGRKYRWGLDFRIEEIVEDGQGAIQYQHDRRGALVATTYPDGSVDHRGVDEVGNLFRTAELQDREYGAVGELRKESTPEGVRVYRYDPEGNLVEREEPDGGVWKYTWDGAGRLRGVVRPDEVEIEYEYDALGRRVSKTVDGEATAWVWDRNVLLHEVCGEGDAAEVTTWVFDPGRFSPAARIDGSGAYSVVTDHLGTPLCLLDDDGAPRWNANIDAWGRARAVGEAELCPWRFAGQYEDGETGLCYNRFRYYDAGQGRYVSRDPIGLAGGTALHGYPSDPTVAFDPLGLSERSDYTRVQRVEATGPHTNQRIKIDEDGNATLLPARKHKDEALFISVENPERMAELLDRRQRQRPGAGNVIREFLVPTRVVERLTRNARKEERGVKRLPGLPTANDNLPGQFGLHPDDAEELLRHAVPGSGRTLGPDDL